MIRDTFKQFFSNFGFAFYNLFFSACLFQFLFVFILPIGVENLLTPSENTNPDTRFIVYFFICIFAEILYLLIKFNSLKIIYKYSKNQYFINFLNKLIKTNDFIIEKQILIFDIIVLLPFIIVHLILELYAGITNPFEILRNTSSFIFEIWTLSIGGVLPCYLLFKRYLKKKNKTF